MFSFSYPLVQPHFPIFSLHGLLYNITTHTPPFPIPSKALYIYKPFSHFHAHHQISIELSNKVKKINYYTKLLQLDKFHMKILALFFVLGFGFVSPIFAGNFNQDFDITWGNERAKILENGKHLTLSLDKMSGSGFRSKKQYLFGKIDMRIKLVPGNSAGTVTTYYLSSLGSNHDEIDFEFLGNLSGDPYIMHTNVYTQGKGNKEQQFYLWFDPTKDFHTYSILWNPQSIIFSVDGTPIRQFKNLESKGLAYPKKQPMWIYSSLWNADDWATRGGLVKTDWSKAPFTASYSSFNALDCISTSCSTNSWFSQALDTSGQERIKWVQKNYMIYNYCTDSKRFPQGFPLECSIA